MCCCIGDFSFRYINDSVDVLQNPITIYAYNRKLIRIADGNLQNDLNSLSLWASTWMMELNPSKCKVLHMGPHNNQISYFMLDKSGTRIQVEAVESERDLGVIVDRKFKVDEHTMQQVQRHPLVIRKSYNALVRPHLEFGFPVTNPQYKGDVAALESVQRRATKLFARRQ